jgi:hypothetical protein
MLTDPDLRALRDAGVIDEATLTDITAFLAERRATGTTPKFDLSHTLWYAGALIIMAAMSLFTTAAFNALGGWALAACGAVYAIVFMGGGHYLWRKRGLKVPGGLLVAIAVSMAPLIIYGVQDALHLWPDQAGDPGTYRDFYNYVNGSWIYMEVGTIIASALAVWRYPFPFILMITAIALWFMSMDLAMWFTYSPQGFDDWVVRRWVSVIFGLVMIIIAWIIDVVLGNEPDFPFWLHIFAAMTFWGGLSASDGGTELQKFIYCLINIGLIGLGVFLGRRVYAVFGALGIATYLGYLAYDVFQDVILFSFALSAIGLAVIAVGLFLHKHRQKITAWMEQRLPAGLKKLRPRHMQALSA